MAEMFDFSGYATRNDIICSDGRTIRKDAFAHQDGAVVPLYWQHDHSSPEMVVGHCLLENRPDGVYAYASMNDAEHGVAAKEAVMHGDINSLSIYANGLQQSAKGDVLHGNIVEVSLVARGANPGAYIDNVIRHSDGSDEFTNECYIYSGSQIDTETEYELVHADDEESKDMDDETVEDVVNNMSEKQKAVLFFLLGKVRESQTAKHSDEEGDNDMKYNVFEQGADNMTSSQIAVLQHGDDLRNEAAAIFDDARRCDSFRDAILAHAESYGITDIEWLFPEVKDLNTPPEFIKRDTDWVAGFLNGVRKSPFSRVRTMFADITEDEARAKGYIKGKRKKEEVFGLLKRSTAPTTIYKKQKLDRDDIIDITDFDVVNWLWREMRIMVNEELARACLIGDGRTPGTDDHIDTNCIRPIWTDDDLFTINVTMKFKSSDDETARTKAMIDKIIRSRKDYKGSGNPIMFTTADVLTDMLLLEDGIGHKLYKSKAELATTLMVRDIVTVEVMEGAKRTVDSENRDLKAIIVNPADYQVGTTRGGEITTFDDFDIHFNQYYYLMETRCSGALIKPKSAIAIETTEVSG